MVENEMAALSKYYSEIMKIHNVTCADVLHPDESCTFFLLKTAPITLFRTAQFFVPLYFVSVVVFFFFKDICEKSEKEWGHMRVSP